MSSRRVSILIVTASILLMFQCCYHTCICDDGRDDDDDLLLEVEEEEGGEVVDIFEPTHEWKTVKEGQAIPAGLHVRMNMETGTKEAKLMPEDITTENSEEISQKGREKMEDAKNPQSIPTGKIPPTFAEQLKNSKSGAEHPGFLFKGDQRRAHYFGHSDRRGIINKRRRVFSQREVAEALKKMDESQADLSKIPGIAYLQPVTDKSHSHKTTNSEKKLDGVKIVHQDRPEPLVNQAIHPELAQMLEHAQTLTRQTSTVPELLQALEELEYHVHHIENAKDLNSIGGMVVVVRLLNHTHPEVRSSAAHVIGSATQSNPQVQAEALEYGALELLCRFIALQEPELVQRRGLFALSALLRGKTQAQLAFMRQCQGLWQLGHNFDQRTMPTRLKSVTLLTDLLHEQEEQLHSSDELKTLIHSSIQEHGWCQHVPTLLHSDTPKPTEKALQAMSVLQHLCDFTVHVSRLQELSQQFKDALSHDQEEDEVSQSLLQHSQDLITNIRNRNKEL